MSVNSEQTVQGATAPGRSDYFMRSLVSANPLSYEHVAELVANVVSVDAGQWNDER
jgi:hypothetical protein